MKIDLAGKTAIVTGSTEGIGYAIAKRLAGAGASVVINGRARAKIGDAVARLKRDLPQGDIRGTAADLATAEGCAALVAAEPRATSSSTMRASSSRRTSSTRPTSCGTGTGRST